MDDQQHDVVHETKVLVNSVRVVPTSDDEEIVEQATESAALLHNDTVTGEDPYFTEHPEEIDSDDSILQVFDFDVASLASSDTRLLLFVLEFLTVLFLLAASSAAPLVFLVPIGCVTLSGFYRLRKLQASAMHVAVTQKGVVFVQERQPTWYCRKGHRRLFLPYRLIRSITYRDPTGDCYFGLEDSVSRIHLYIRKHANSSHRFLLGLRGVKDAETFHDLVAERINTQDDTEDTSRVWTWLNCFHT